MSEENQVPSKIIEIHGKNGEIKLVIPNSEPTEKELNDFHRIIAETKISSIKGIKPTSNKIKE